MTRQNQILTRWVDQGATMAAPLALVPSRHQAGTIEKALTEILADKSHWQKMLKSGNQRPQDELFFDKFFEVQKWLKDVLLLKPELKPILPIEAAQGLTMEEQNGFLFEEPKAVKINFPVPDVMDKIKSVSLEKEKKIEGKITGIKGQYVFFGDRVFNMRNHEGAIILIENL